VSGLAVLAAIDVADDQGDRLAGPGVESAVVGDDLLQRDVGLQDDRGVGHLAVDVQHLAAEPGGEILQLIAAVLGSVLDGVDRDSCH